ncbi:RagB/SusD family nutrient uptake outer membrane protein [Pedobacter frigoris]|uniref:RagB/SusD family nutrient uptake outer membrane protein n=1 Tax=Pedobacter frigoris TaxID=2571272 RepID=UPI00292FF7D5|nr:RagB/SusD family nutrient uptake outer membrane protein [Pedobacter frigoris]
MMKRYYILIVAALMFTATGCKKMIEDGPLEFIDEDRIFNPADSLGTYSDQYLNNIYSGLPKGFNRIGNNILDAGSDDAVPNNILDNVQYFSTGAINSTILPENAWDANYSNIRKVNIFLSKVDRVNLKASLKGYKERWKAEARALRAMFYFELLKRWSGVPLIGDKVFAVNEKIQVPRNSYQECVTYITSELDAVMPLLLAPNATGTFSATFYGRFSRGAAMALKAKVLLYAASPLNNPNNDLSKWAAAAKAAKDIIDSVAANKFTYKLNDAATTAHYSTTTLAGITTSANLSTYVTSVNKFLSIFSTANNNEIILPYMSTTNQTVESANDPIGYARSGSGKTNPTQELVNAFEMYSGKTISESGTDYNSNTPYYNRDPRLVGTVMFDGLYWLTRKVQTYDGGLDRPLGFGNTNNGETRTGYYMRKFMTSNASATSFANTNHVFPIIRYAEVLLNYAEAQNEAVGADASVYKAINDIRARVNMPALPAGLTPAAMKERIRNERRVEMAFEEQRFWDIRRWEIAGTVLNGTLNGVKGTLSGTTVTYTTVPVVPVKFDISKMYLFPIPFNEVVSNPSMTQNPNW